MIQNIHFEFEGAAPSKEREALFVKSLQMWLRPFSEDINRQDGRLVLIFCKDGSNKFRVENVDLLLSEKIASQFPKFVSRAV